MGWLFPGWGVDVGTPEARHTFDAGVGPVAAATAVVVDVGIAGIPLECSKGTENVIGRAEVLGVGSAQVLGHHARRMYL